jgi:hypothetical protein
VLVALPLLSLSVRVTEAARAEGHSVRAQVLIFAPRAR